MTGLPRAARSILIATTLLGLALLVAACSGSGSGSGGASSAPVATSTVDLPPSYKFVPADITVNAGTTVTWTNHDNFTHSVQFKDGGLPTDAKLIKPGEQTTFTFTTAGTFHYQCSLHPQQMQGTVTVTP
ncbi:MAG TPA: plastocyanin/azurin family copper-binding protein [Candidatus Limnocylindrales bacterium]|jgi:plastocyanin|nr:plastocyanin/azurin family copper-binding protein [Candidatus Limnocylindrales bacterium]